MSWTDLDDEGLTIAHAATLAAASRAAHEGVAAEFRRLAALLARERRERAAATARLADHLTLFESPPRP